MVRRGERGFALLMGLTVLGVLTVLGLSVMSSMGEDLVVVRNMRESENALAIAEAGLAWGLDKLNSDPSNQGYLFDDVKNYNQVLQDPNNYYFDLPATASDDPLCTGLKDAQCDVWREITDKSNPELFGAAARLLSATTSEIGNPRSRQRLMNLSSEISASD